MDRKFLILISSCLLAAGAALAHEGHHHPAAEAKVTPTEKDKRDKAFGQIEAVYRVEIKPIFQKSCFDCHSNVTTYPWYYKIPGIKQWIDSDIAESKEHLDFSQDFPFKSHASPEEDLQAIIDEVESGDMPPFRYRLMHSDRKLTSEEKAKVITWASDGLSGLSTVPDKEH